MVAFGLILNVSNINELDRNKEMPAIEKAKNTGLSIFLVIIFSSLLGISYIADLKNDGTFNHSAVKYLSVTLSCAALIFSYSIFKRVKV